VQAEEKWQQVIRELQQGSEKYPGFAIKQEVLFYKERLVVWEKSSWIPTLLQEFHITPQRGHSGFYRTYCQFASNLYWKGMKSAIQNMSRSVIHVNARSM
jgi:hypothetical protein